MMSARPPNAAAGNPAAHDLAEGEQVSVNPVDAVPPGRETRKPVMTSSMISSAPCRCAISRSAALKPVAGATTPMFAAAASVMTQAICRPCSVKAASTAARSL